MNHKDTTQKRILAKCPKCHRPIAEVRGNTIYFLKQNAGKQMTSSITVKHDAGGRFDLNCESCGVFSFSTVQKTMGMSYVVDPNLKAEEPVEKSVVDIDKK